MANGIKTGDPRWLNKGRSSKFHEGFNFNKHLKKAGGHIGWNVVEIAMKTIVQKLLMIKSRGGILNLQWIASLCSSFIRLAQGWLKISNHLHFCLFSSHAAVSRHLYFFFLDHTCFWLLVSLVYFRPFSTSERWVIWSPANAQSDVTSSLSSASSLLLSLGLKSLIVYFSGCPCTLWSLFLLACHPRNSHGISSLLSTLRHVHTTYPIYQPLRSGRIWRKVNF